MQARLLLNLCLLIAATGLAVFLLQDSNKKTGPAEVLLTTVPPETVTRIQIIRADHDTLSFVKQSGSWQMQHPYAVTANEIRINALLNLLRASSYSRFNKKDLQLSNFQLDKPQVSITFNETRMDFGEASPLGEQRYVLVNNEVHLINDSPYQQLQAPATFFLSPRLLPAGKMIHAIKLPDHELRIQNGVWTITPETNIGADKLVELVNAWRDAEAISINKYEDGDSGDKILVELGDQDLWTFLLINKPQEFILARPDLGIQYHLLDYYAEKLFITETGKQETTVGADK